MNLLRSEVSDTAICLIIRLIIKSKLLMTNPQYNLSSKSLHSTMFTGVVAPISGKDTHTAHSCALDSLNHSFVHLLRSSDITVT